MGPEIESLQSCLQSVPDPGKKRGVRFPLVPMLLLGWVGLLARQSTLQSIIDHARLHWPILGPGLGFGLAFGVPHATTLSRLLARVDPAALPAAFGSWLIQVVTGLVEVAAVDGKYPHQSHNEAGEPFGLLNVFVHDLKACLWQWVISDKAAEPSVLKAHLDDLFTRYPLLRILTGDALFAQRGLCEALVAARRGYLLRVKGNQPELQAALKTTFEVVSQEPPHAQTVDKAGSKIETRRLWLDSETAHYAATELNFAGAQQVARLDKLSHDLNTQQVKQETWSLLSCDPHGPLTAAQLLQRARGHWSVENSLHLVEDRSWGEDKHVLRRPGLGPCFSMLLAMALTILRLSDQFDPKLSMPRRAKQCEANPHLALALLT